MKTEIYTLKSKERPKSLLLLVFLFLLLQHTGWAQSDEAGLIRAFSETHEDSAFIQRYSVIPFERFVIEQYNLPRMFNENDSFLFYHHSPGDILGPFQVDSLILYVKVIAADSGWRMHPGNIWLNPEKRKKENIDKLAQQILKTANKTGNFDALCKKYSDDNNKNFESDLGWFFQGMMVKEFDEAILPHKKGDIFSCKTRFGTHVVKILDNPVYDRRRIEYVFLYLKAR